MDRRPEQVAADFATQFFSSDPDVRLEGIHGSGRRTILLRLKHWSTERMFRRYMIKMAFEEPDDDEWALVKDTTILEVR